MPIVSTSITVSTTASKLLDDARGRRWIAFSNETGSKVHVGGPGTVAGTGVPILNGTTFVVAQQHENDSTPEQAWWGRVDNSTGPVIVTYAVEDSTD
jgi:hypothetical protein